MVKDILLAITRVSFAVSGAAIVIWGGEASILGVAWFALALALTE